MPEANLLAIDNGTQSVRALLFDLQGNLRQGQGRAAALLQQPARLGRAGSRVLLAKPC